MALLLSARRGWLPAGFTELEYLESSGTQRIITDISTNINSVFTADYQTLYRRGVLQVVFRAHEEVLWEYGEFGGTAATSDQVGYIWAGSRGITVRSNYANILCGSRNTIHVSYSKYRFEGYPEVVLPSSAEQNSTVSQNLLALFYSYAHRIFNFKHENATLGVKNDLVPVLDADGTPCMFDKISRKCFYNSGTGTFGYRIKTADSEASTFSLRDPYYTAPSGVWAKLVAENTLGIIADTDMQDGEEQGYTWFANTGEAYEHFGIKQEELLTE